MADVKNKCRRHTGTVDPATRIWSCCKQSTEKAQQWLPECPERKAWKPHEECEKRWRQWEQAKANLAPNAFVSSVKPNRDFGKEERETGSRFAIHNWNG